MSSLKTFGSDHPVMQYHIQEEWNSQLHHCENAKACSLQNLCIHADVVFQQNIKAYLKCSMKESSSNF
jgi:hypothetical protein